MKRFALALVALLCIVAGLTTTGWEASAAVDGDDFRGEDFPVDLRWVPCFAEVGPDFECATARVPLDYDKLDGGRVPIDLVRLPATGERLGSLFLNPGGPGGSGIDFAVGAGPFLYTPEVRAAYDLVGFDPRGIIRSNPLLCFGTFNASLRASRSFLFPTNPDEEDILRRVGSLLRTQCRNRGGIIINKMSTANVARDLEVLRAAVGDEQLNYAGYSYGSIIGQTYANLFPDRVGQLVIDGIWNLEDYVGDPSGRSSTTLEDRVQAADGTEDTFKEFLRLCDEAGPPTCAIAPDAARRAQAVLDGMEARGHLEVVDPATGQVVFVISYQDVVTTVWQALYQPSVYAALSVFFAELELLLDGAAPAGVSVQRTLADIRAASGDKLATHRPLPPYPNFVEGQPGVLCSDTSNPLRFDGWAASAEANRVDAPNFGPLLSWFTSTCRSWPGKDLDRFNGPYGRETANEILILTTRYDPITSFEQAVKARAVIPGSSLVTVEGWGHTTLFTSTCADAIIADYLLNDVLPADGTTCPVDLGTPFTGPGSGSVGAQVRLALLREVSMLGF